MRPLVPAALGFAAALLLSELIGSFAIVIAAICALVFTIWYFIRRSAGVSHLRASAAVFSCAATAAAMWHLIFTLVFYLPAAELAGSSGIFHATVRGYSQAYNYGSGVEVELEEAGGARTRLWFNEVTDLSPGDKITFTATLNYPTSSPDFDFLEYYRAKRVFLSGKVTEMTDVEYAKHTPLRFLPMSFSRALGERLERLYSGDTLAVVKALTVGDRSDMSDAFRLEVRASGLSHLLAISGLHVTLLCGMLLALFGRRRRRLGIPVAILTALMFVLISGASPSAQRAFLMHGLALGAMLFRRDADAKTAISASLILILLINPFAISDLGLQLSFLSTFGILSHLDSILKWLNSKITPKRLIQKTVWKAASSAIAMTAVATLYTAPLIAYNFGSLPLFGVFANPFAMLFVPIALVGGLLSGLLSFVWFPAARSIAAVVTLCVDALRFIAGSFAKLPFSIIDARDPYNLCAMALGYVLFIIWYFSPDRKHGKFCAAAVFFAFVLSMTLGEVSRRTVGMEVIVLDIGQGQSILLTSHGETALVDCGGDAYGGAGCIAAEELMLSGTRHLDMLILTHYHTDHANGLTDLLRFVRIGTAYLPLPYEESDDDILELLEYHGAGIVFVDEEDMLLPLGDADLTVFRPVGDSSDENETGISILAECDNFGMLMTGDLGVDSERALLERTPLASVEVFVAGHHGSKGSTSDYLLDQITPKIAVISVGYNTYGHPHRDALTRLTNHDCDIYRTDLGGNIRLRVG